jgi:hypothetical protein
MVNLVTVKLTHLVECKQNQVHKLCEFRVAFGLVNFKHSSPGLLNQLKVETNLLSVLE